MPTLQSYFDAERLRRGWSMREVARRSQISLSKAYAIVNGEDNVEFETFENIATAFGLTPAELAVVIGKGRPGEHDPEEAELLALFRQIPSDKRMTAKDVLRVLSIGPLNKGPDNRRRDAQANRDRRAAAKLDPTSRPQGLPDDEDGDNHLLKHGHWWRNPSRTATVERRLASVTA